MKPKRPQFVKMNASREENPPPRDVRCPDYRHCLTEAAFNNFSLDCSQCAPMEAVGCSPGLSKEIFTRAMVRPPAARSLPV